MLRSTQVDQAEWSEEGLEPREVRSRWRQRWW
jgi:hypothetical protein